MVIHGKVKKKHIVKALLQTAFWTLLALYHYHIQVHKFVLIYMVLGAVSSVYDAVCAISWYRKQEKNIRPTDFF